jgi:Leucine-rich repeat (LRR) protein
LLNLSGNQLRHVSKKLKRNQKLQHLDLSDNELQRLPELVCKLPSLKYLDMSGNELTTLPECFSKLSSLTVSSFGDKQLFHECLEINMIIFVVFIIG